MATSFSLLTSVGRGVWAPLLDAFFPPRCAGCTEWSRDAFCRFCVPKLKPLTVPLCTCCGAPFDPLAFPAPLCRHCRDKEPHYLAARSAFDFDGPMREAIHRLKYQEKTALAPRLAPFLAETITTDAALQAFKPDWIVPIPLHPRRLRQRGYNQSFLLARELGRSLEVPVAQLLQRQRNTPPQVGLKRADRAKNIKDAFIIDGAAFAGIGGSRRCFLLIDDVFTTGATLNEAAHILKKAGATEVCALTLARQV